MNAFKCLNCDGGSAKPLYSNVPDRFHGFEGLFSYVTCDSCGLVQIDHVPDDVGKYYKGYRVYSGDSRLYRAIRKLTIGHAYVEAEGRGRKLLDVGCGNGSYLQDMAKHGWDVTGYEFDPAYAATLSKQLGVPVISGEAELAACKGTFDLITFNFVFEHLDRPLRMLELATDALAPGGELYILVPNIDSREASMFRDRWFHLDPPRHIAFFTKDHLRERLAAAGYVDIAVKDVGIPTGFAGSLSYRIMNTFNRLVWYASIAPGMVFSRVVPDGNFAITARRPR